MSAREDGPSAAVAPGRGMRSLAGDSGPGDGDMVLTPTVAEKIRQANIDVHRREAPMYDALHSEILGASQQRMVRRELDLIGQLMPPGTMPRAMDVGCGTGNLTLQLLARGFSVRAVDLSPEMIDVLRSKLAAEHAERTELVVSDAEAALEDEAEGGWDVISFSAVLHHLPNYETVIKNALRRLKPGGVLYVCHEPLRRGSSQPGVVDRLAGGLCRMLDGAAVRARVRVVYGWQSLRARKRLPRLDYTWSDYHVRAGIDMHALLATLERSDARTVFQDTYPSYYSSLVAALAARLGTGEPDHFRFAVQRTA